MRARLGFGLGLAAGLAAGLLLATAAPFAAQPGPAASVLFHHQAEQRVAPSGKASVRVLARGANAFLGLLRMNGGGQVPLHRDESEELVYILSGTGTITIDGVSSEVAAGSAIYMPGGAEVTFRNGARELVALQVFADPTSAAKYDGWKVLEPAD